MTQSRVAGSVEPGQKSFLQLLSIAIGFFGIQYAWAVQYSQMSTFLESLGSVAWLTALIWCAGPITGTFTQPILAAFSDRTWGRLGSRRPYLLAGAVICAVCMVLMPNSPNLLTAALILWVWDTSINVCQGPIRWLAVDVVNKEQQPLTFSLMGFVLAVGAAVCFYLGSVNPDIHYLFYFGATAMLLSMGWTIFSTPETKLPHLEGPQPKVTLGSIIKESWHGLKTMHPEAQKLCWVNGLTWFGGQCMFVFFPLFMVHNIFNTTDTQSLEYIAGRQHVSACWLAYYVVCFVASLAIGPLTKKFSMKAIHTVGLLGMGLSLLVMAYATTPEMVLVTMGIAGVGWATTMAVPFALAAQYAPADKGGLHMGLFNLYIAFASFIANLIVGVLVETTHNEASAILLAGGAVTISAILLQIVQEKDATPVTSTVVASAS